jgi:hypothetical protein
VPCSSYVTCVYSMKLTFVELPAFSRYREDYLDDDEYRKLQAELLAHPTAGDVLKARAASVSFASATASGEKESAAESA